MRSAGFRPYFLYKPNYLPSLKLVNRAPKFNITDDRALLSKYKRALRESK